MNTTMSQGTPRILKLDGGLSVVPGLRTAGVASGIKPAGQLDLGVLVADSPWTVAGVFTKNQAAAAPVLLCRERLAAQSVCRVVVVNSGNANALTGERGWEDARAVVHRAEQVFGGPALMLSTGVIGVPLPREKALAGLDGCAERLGRTSRDFPQAMLTTDTRSKESARRVLLGDDTWVHVGGVAKGSGMIHPDMATMLSILATDAPISESALEGLLRRVADSTFNRISIDGDTSTNDAVLALAQPGGADAELSETDPRFPLLEEAFRQVAADLAEQIVADGEGATRVLELRVHGARWMGDARAVARAIIGSPLVKTALNGGDANWGRIIAAAGNAGVPFEVNALTLRIGGAVVFSGGGPHTTAQAAAERHFQEDRVCVDLEIGAGASEVTVLTSDLSAEYVAINANYRT